MQQMQSRAARLLLGGKKRYWSYTTGLKDLKWLSIPQMAVEATLRGAIKVLKAKKLENLYESLVDEEGKLKYPTEASLNNMKI